MNETGTESMVSSDIYQYIIYEYIRKNFEPVDDKPGYVWFNKRNYQIISIETLAKSLENTWVKRLHNLPFAESEKNNVE